MSQEADYGISRVRYNDKKTYIVKVEVSELKGDLIQPKKEWTRSEVVSEIESGKSFITVINNTKGRDVHIIIVKGEKFIRSDANQEASDNLGELPEF